MSKKVIVLADNSYTIRRIVELSFSEIENIEVRSYENGSGIKEKLLQLNPAVVIVDIKLPEVSGYEVCRYINETPSLNRSRVFLMKGSFEPVDNEMIKNLKYEDIITKPFDSNALVSTVMKIVNKGEQGQVTEFAGEGPSTFPEDFPEIEPGAPESEDISFSDIRSEMEAPPVFERPAFPDRDEILPSEEITQGTQPIKDNLMPQETEEPLKNPFEEEPAFEEISVSPPVTSRPAPLEYEKEPTPVPPGAGVPRDTSDEFHEHFLDMANEDTSEDLLKASLEAPQMAESEDMHFPADQKAEEPKVTEEKYSEEFEKTDMGSPAKTIYAGPDIIADFAAAARKAPKAAEPESRPEAAPEKERPVEKPRAEALSPQEELARLAGVPKREAKAEAKTESKAEARVDAGIPEQGKFEFTTTLEEKLSLTIRELLWEIVPPLADKIIKEEIDKIKSDLGNSGL